MQVEYDDDDIDEELRKVDENAVQEGQQDEVGDDEEDEITKEIER